MKKIFARLILGICLGGIFGLAIAGFGMLIYSFIFEMTLKDVLTIFGIYAGIFAVLFAVMKAIDWASDNC